MQEIMLKCSGHTSTKHTQDYVIAMGRDECKEVYRNCSKFFGIKGSGIDEMIKLKIDKDIDHKLKLMM